MPNTVYEFWLMIFQNNKKHSNSEKYQMVIMLTDFIENERQKCATYFPNNENDCIVCQRNGSEYRKSKSKINDKNSILGHNTILIKNDCIDSMDYLDISNRYSITDNFFLIKNICITTKSGYSIRKLHVFYCEKQENQKNEEKQFTSKSFYIHHYWFPDWPDHKSPDNIDVLLDFSLDILDDDIKETTVKHLLNPLPIIHCSAGIGRTGCLAAILNGIRQIRSSMILSPKVNETKLKEDHTQSNISKINIDILGIVCNLRLQRGGMVQNSEQYELIHRALCLYHERLL